MIQAFNQTIEYIEGVLDGEIDEGKIAVLSGYSYPLFSRIFEPDRMEKMIRPMPLPWHSRDSIVIRPLKSAAEQTSGFSPQCACH